MNTAPVTCVGEIDLRTETADSGKARKRWIADASEEPRADRFLRQRRSVAICHQVEEGWRLPPRNHKWWFCDNAEALQLEMFALAPGQTTTNPQEHGRT